MKIGMRVAHPHLCAVSFVDYATAVEKRAQRRGLPHVERAEPCGFGKNSVGSAGVAANQWLSPKKTGIGAAKREAACAEHRYLHKF